MNILTAEEFDFNKFKGKWIILFFYPKDNTPGCTIEACSFRDLATKLDTTKVLLIGVSSDSISSHKKFYDKFNLNYTLISDPNRILIQKFGCIKEKTIFGKKIKTTSRDTFIIDPEGKIIKEYRAVNPITHIKSVYEDLKSLKLIL